MMASFHNRDYFDYNMFIALNMAETKNIMATVIHFTNENWDTYLFPLMGYMYVLNKKKTNKIRFILNTVGIYYLILCATPACFSAFYQWSLL